MKRTFLDYTLDFLYATFRYHNGFTKPRVWFGYFEGETAQIQQTFFIKLMMDDGFKRTPFQLVFPGQTAEIIRKIEGNREHHVRFYSDGTIECEEEVGRFDMKHYVGERHFVLKILEEIIDRDSKLLEEPEQLKRLLGKKHYSASCLRTSKVY